jgi:hypothetical protein
MHSILIASRKFVEKNSSCSKVKVKHNGSKRKENKKSPSSSSLFF